MSKKESKLPVDLGSAGLLGAAGVVIVFGIVVAVNFLGSALNFRVDLTEDKIYTLSDGTRRIVSDMDTPVTLRFYVSDDMTSLPQELKNMTRRVEDFLLEYKKASGGMIRVEKYRVKQDSDEEDSAALDGIRPSGGGLLGMGGDPIYFGLSISCLDQKIAMPFIPARPETLLEYDLSRAITQVLSPEKPRVAIMTSLEVAGGFDPQNFQAGPKPAWVFHNELSQDYDVSVIGTDVEKIVVEAGSDGEGSGKTPDVLLVLHPHDIGPTGEYAIDQYLLGGGKVISLLDPMFFTSRFLSQAAPGPMQPPPTIATVSTFTKLLGAWGVEFDSTKVLADMQYRTSLRGGIVSPTVLSLGEEAINSSDPVTAQLKDVSLVFAGGLVVNAPDGLESEVLLQSSALNQLILPAEAEPSQGFQKLIDEFSSSGVEKAFAVRLAGEFSSAFPDGDPNAAPEEEEKAEDEEKSEDEEDSKADDTQSESLVKSAEPGVVVLFSDADFIYDQFAVQQQNMLGQRFIIPLNGNLSLLQNTVEQLAGDANLINVRSRSAARRPFTKINEMEAAAEQKFSAKIQELENDVRETQLRLNSLQAGKDENQKFVLSAEQQAEIESVNKRVAEKNRELREVRKDLRRDIDSMVSGLKAINIAAMPVAVIIIGLGLAAARRSKRAAR